METEIAQITGGGAFGIAATWLSLFLTGRLRDPKSVVHLESDIVDLKNQLDKKDNQLAEKETYVRQIIADMNEQNEEIRRTMIPNLVQQLFMFAATKGKESNGHHQTGIES